MKYKCYFCDVFPLETGIWDIVEGLHFILAGKSLYFVTVQKYHTVVQMFNLLYETQHLLIPGLQIN